MELYFLARFHVRAGTDSDAEPALVDVGPSTRGEAGCLEWHGFCSFADPRLFVVTSVWRDQSDFDAHADLPHTRRFIKAMTAIVDSEPEFVRGQAII